MNKLPQLKPEQSASYLPLERSSSPALIGTGNYNHLPRMFSIVSNYASNRWPVLQATTLSSCDLTAVKRTNASSCSLPMAEHRLCFYVHWGEVSLRTIDCNRDRQPPSRVSLGKGQFALAIRKEPLSWVYACPLACLEHFSQMQNTALHL